MKGIKVHFNLLLRHEPTLLDLALELWTWTHSAACFSPDHSNVPLAIQAHLKLPRPPVLAASRPGRDRRHAWPFSELSNAAFHDLNLDLNEVRLTQALIIS